MLIKRFFGIIFFVYTTIYLFPLICHAEQVGFSVDQSIFTIDSEPGKIKDLRIKIQSISAQEQQMGFDVEDFNVDDNNEISILQGSNELCGMKDWIKGKEKDWFLKPDELKEVQLSIKIPQDASVGAHYALISLRALPKIDAGTFGQTQVNGRIGIYVMLNVLGDVSAKGTLSRFQSPTVVENDVALQAEFENTGNILYIPHGEVKIVNLFTGKEDKLEAEKHFVFPGKKYSFDLKWHTPSVLGIYTADASFVDGEKNIHRAQKVLMGKYFFVTPILTIVLFFVGYRVYKNVKCKPSSRS